MPRQYMFVTQDDEDEIIVALRMAQERDIHGYETDLERLVRALAKLESREFDMNGIDAGDYDKLVKHYRKRVSDTRLRIIEVNNMMEATEPQLPPQGRIESAKVRIAEKRANTPRQ